MDDQQNQSVTDYLSNMFGKGVGAVKDAFSQPGLGQKILGATGIPVISDIANAKSLTDSMHMPMAPAPKAPVESQEDYQSAQYKPPFGNEAVPPAIDKGAMPDTAVADDSDDETRKSNPKVVSSHPGFDQDALEKYLQDQKGQIDKYGADQMAQTQNDIQTKNHSAVNGLAHAGSQFADAMMQGVARAGNPGFDKSLTERQQHNDEMRMGAMKEENAANVAAQKSKMALDTQSSHNALGAASASAIMPMLQKVYPGKTDAEYQAMARNPAVAEALLPEGVKLRDADARLEQAKSDKAFSHQMALDNMAYRKDHDAVTREQKDTSGMLKDPNVVKAQGTLDKLGTARGLLESGNVNNATAKQALQTALTFVATGGQRVNETEMKQLGGAHTVTNRINQWMQGLDRGTLTPKDYHDMKQVIGIYENGAHQSLNEATDRYAGIQAQREGISRDQARKNLTGGSATPQASQPHPQDDQAMQWAQANPTDPRAIRILKANGR